MKRYLLALLPLFILAGCASLPTATVYKPGYPKAPLCVADLSFEKINQTWEKPEEWNKHVRDWQSKFWSSLMDRYPNISRYDKNQLPKTGLIAKSYVTTINRKWNAFLGGTDNITLEVELYDASTNEKVAMIPYMTDSSSAGWASMSFGGRIEACAGDAGIILGRYFEKNK